MALLLKTLVLLQVLKLASLDELEEIVASGKDSASDVADTDGGGGGITSGGGRTGKICRVAVMVAGMG